MKKLLLTWYVSFLTTFSFAQVGMGTSTPNATAVLQVDAGASLTKGFLVTGLDQSGGLVPDLGAGSRLMFYPAKSAFRAGGVDGTQWNNANVGMYSVAMGFNTKATNSSAVALGISSTASGEYATALGRQTTASGYAATAIGNFSAASGTASIALGNNCAASGYASTAIGNYVSTNNQQGSFIIGDNGATFTLNSTDWNQFMARFSGGYVLYSNSAGNTGVQLPSGGNAWTSICDKNRKENFLPVDGEEVLQKLSRINITSWNYKTQDPKTYRHYGIMAQDFFEAFGKDHYGTIGNDTTVNPIDMIGIDMAAIKALEKRTRELKEENKALKDKLAAVDELKKENELLKQSLAQIQKQVEMLAQKETKGQAVAAK